MENLESHGIYYLNFQAWKVMELKWKSWKVMEKQYAFGKYKGKTIKKIENNIMSLS